MFLNKGDNNTQRKKKKKKKKKKKGITANAPPHQRGTQKGPPHQRKSKKFKKKKKRTSNEKNKGLIPPPPPPIPEKNVAVSHVKKGGIGKKVFHKKEMKPTNVKHPQGKKIRFKKKKKKKKSPHSTLPPKKKKKKKSPQSALPPKPKTVKADNLSIPPPPPKHVETKHDKKKKKKKFVHGTKEYFEWDKKNEYSKKGKLSRKEFPSDPDIPYLTAKYPKSTAIMTIVHQDITSLPRIQFATTFSCLVEIDISFNKLTSLTFLSNLNSLKKLNCSSNKISTISDISNVNELETLNISFNNFTSLTGIRNFPKLKRLYAGWNQLEDISPEISECKNLATIKLTSNRISTIPEAMKQLKSLRRLDIDSNQLLNLSDFYNITHCSLLCSLRISNNPFLTSSDDEIKLRQQVIQILKPTTGLIELDKKKIKRETPNDKIIGQKRKRDAIQENHSEATVPEEKSPKKRKLEPKKLVVEKTGFTDQKDMFGKMGYSEKTAIVEVGKQKELTSDKSGKVVKDKSSSGVVSGLGERIKSVKDSVKNAVLDILFSPENNKMEDEEDEEGQEDQNRVSTEFEGWY